MKMSKDLPPALAEQYRYVKAAAGILLLLLMSLPMLVFGSLLLQDGTYAGRWEFAASAAPEPIECRGVPYVAQYCSLKFTDAVKRRQTQLDYLVSGDDWRNRKPDVVRSSLGHFSSSIAITSKGIIGRFGSLLGLLLLGLVIVQFLLYLYWQFLKIRAPRMWQARQQSKDAVLLSRDRRDHL